MTRWQQKRQRLMGGWMTCAVGLLLVGQLGNVGHRLLVRHSICPAHGEVVHAQPGPAASTILLRDEPTDAFSRPGQPDADQHDHCIPLGERSRFLFDNPGCEPLSLQPVRIRIQSTGRALVAARGRLLLAPKTSPPV